jgi:hypothetical protein
MQLPPADVQFTTRTFSIFCGCRVDEVVEIRRGAYLATQQTFDNVVGDEDVDGFEIT